MRRGEDIYDRSGRYAIPINKLVSREKRESICCYNLLLFDKPGPV